MLKIFRRLESATAETSVHLSPTALSPTCSMIVPGIAVSVATGGDAGKCCTKQ